MQLGRSLLLCAFFSVALFTQVFCVTPSSQTLNTRESHDGHIEKTPVLCGQGQSMEKLYPLHYRNEL